MLLYRLLSKRARTQVLLRKLRAAELGSATRIAELGVLADEALPLATELGDAALVKQLLLQGARPASFGPGGVNLCWLASRSRIQPFEKLKALSAAGADLDAPAGARPLSLLCYACAQGDLATARELIRLGASRSRADRFGLRPISAARASGNEDLERLIAEGLPDPELEPARSVLEVEKAFILGRMLYSELHELCRWVFRNSGFELLRLRLEGAIVESLSTSASPPGESLLRYTLGLGGPRFVLTLGISDRGEISALLFDQDEAEILENLLPPEDRITPGLLRSHLVTRLKLRAEELLDGAYLPGPEGSPRIGAKRRPRQESEPSSDHLQAGPALKVLGLSAGATRSEILAAYRKLAKRFHPDLAPNADVTAERERKMKELNLAYGELNRGDRKKT